MNRSTIIRTSVAAGIAGAGLVVGGLGIASAAEGARSGSAVPADSAVAPAPGAHGHGHRGGHGPGGAELAEALGVTEDELQAAFEAVREQLESSETDRSTPPTEAEREERRQQMAAALAQELDLSAAEVTAAFEKIHEERSAERRTVLSERLDEAVTAGELTSADKASVLKAFDAGVLGVGHEGGRGGR